MLEGKIADVADDIPNHSHDTQDGLEAGLRRLGGLRGLELWALGFGFLHIFYGACMYFRYDR